MHPDTSSDSPFITSQDSLSDSFFNSAADSHLYEDMLRLPRPRSSKYPPISKANRAAQFSPFAALTGYEAAVTEAARHTQGRILLDDNRRALLDTRLTFIQEHLTEHPLVSITYFIPDTKKEGGAYVSRMGNIHKIDTYARHILFHIQENDALLSIPIDDIIDLEEVSTPNS